jgi:hypothetical protein
MSNKPGVGNIIGRQDCLFFFPAAPICRRGCCTLDQCVLFRIVACFRIRGAPAPWRRFCTLAWACAIRIASSLDSRTRSCGDRTPFEFEFVAGSPGPNRLFQFICATQTGVDRRIPALPTFWPFFCCDADGGYCTSEL